MKNAGMSQRLLNDRIPDNRLRLADYDRISGRAWSKIPLRPPGGISAQNMWCAEASIVRHASKQAGLHTGNTRLTEENKVGLTNGLHTREVDVARKTPHILYGQEKIQI